MNRILTATDNTIDQRYSLSWVSYDKNGNIRRLHRNGHINEAATSFGLMDGLEYTYDSGNKLIKVKDTGNGTYGFKNGIDILVEYTYDTNGNLLSDANKQISSIEYNHLNMPTKITVTGANAGVLDYNYSADGTKLQKIKTKGGNTTTTDYAGNFVYENNVLKQFNHPEGYVEPDGSGYQYVYRLTDIWGNTRITFADDNNDGSVNSSEIRKEQNFYPFGLEHRGYNSSSYGAENNLKTYQRQELNKDLDLNVHEWKYRFGDPAIARFWQVDPLAEDYVYNGVYNFSENDPVSSVELEGLEKLSVHIAGKYKSDNFSGVIVGTAKTDIRNNNSTTFYVAGQVSGGSPRAIKGSYDSENGLHLSSTESNSKENIEISYKASLVKGMKIPDFIAKIGIEKAIDNVGSDSIEEILNTSDEEAEQNEMIIGILMDIKYLLENDIIDGYVSFGSSEETSKDENGKTITRKFGNTYSAKASNLTYDKNGIYFNGSIVVSFTEEETDSDEKD